MMLAPNAAFHCQRVASVSLVAITMFPMILLFILILKTHFLWASIGPSVHDGSLLHGDAESS